MTPNPSLDLTTLNAAQAVAVRSLQNQVCTWEQQSADCALNGDLRSAQQYKDWAFACDLAVHYVSSAIGALFLETLESFPLVQDTRTVKLPDLDRSPEDRYLDTLSVEVASAQPCPSDS